MASSISTPIDSDSAISVMRVEGEAEEVEEA